MSIKEYSYQKTRWDSIEKCVKWGLNNLQLRDWQVEIVEDNLTDEYANAEGDINTLRGIIRIDLVFCKKDNVNPYSSILHEILHLFIKDKTKDATADDENIARTLEPILYEKFCRENKIKQAKVRE